MAGFITFTLSLVLAWVWTINFGQASDLWNTKVFWSVMSWFVFVAALGVRAGGGVKERRSALVSVVGFSFIVFSYLGLRLVSSQGGFFL